MDVEVFWYCGSGSNGTKQMAGVKTEVMMHDGMHGQHINAVFICYQNYPTSHFLKT